MFWGWKCLTSSTSCPSLAALLLDYSAARCRARAAGERLCNAWHGHLLRGLSGEKVGSGRKAGVCFLDNAAFLCILDFKARCISPIPVISLCICQDFSLGFLNLVLSG